MAKKLNRNLVGALTLAGMVLLACAGFALLANLPGRDPKVYEEQAKKHEEKSEFDLAAETYQRAYFRDPDNNPEYLVKAAKCYLEDGKVGAARDLIQQSRQRDPKLKTAAELRTDLEYEVAKIFPSSLQWNMVLDEARKLAEMDKGSARAEHILGHALIALQGEDESNRSRGQEALEKAMELDPFNADAVEILAKDRWIAANQEKANGDKAKAEAMEKSANAALASCIEKCPASEAKKVAKLKRLQALYELANGRVNEGLALLRKLADEEKDGAESHITLGQMYLGGMEGLKADPAKAEEAYKRAAQIAPKDGAAYDGLAQVYEQMRSTEKDEAKRAALRDKQSEVYRQGLETIQKTKHFRSMKDNLFRVSFIKELFQLDLERAFAGANDAKQKGAAMASAESWVSVLKDEIDAGSKDVRFMNAALYNARGDQVSATKEAEAANRLPGADRDIRLQLLLSELYANKEQWGLARDALLRLTTMLPNAPQLRLRLARIYLHLNDPSMAMLELKPRDPGPVQDFMNANEGAAALRIEAYRQLNQSQLATEEIQRLDKGKGGTGAEMRQAIVLMSDGKHAEAEVIVKKVLGREPTNETAVRALFRIYEVMDRRSEAATFVDDLRTKTPDSALYRQLKLMLLYAAKAPDAEIMAVLNEEKDALRRELAIADYLASGEKHDEAMKHLDAAEGVKSDDPQVIDRQLRVSLASKNWARAEKYVERDAALNSDGTEGLLARGRLAFAKGDYSSAITLIKSGVEKYPSYAMGWTYLGETHLASNQIGEAKAAFNKAIEIDPTNGFANRGLADLILREGDEKGAQRYLEGAARALPDDRWTLRQMQIASERKSPEKGILAREKIRQENPNDLDNLVLLSRLYSHEDVRQFDRAEETYRAALALSKTDMGLVRELAMYFARDDVNQPAKGHELLEGLLRDEQDAAKKSMIAVTLGQFYEKQKTLATADRYFRTAVSLDKSPQTLNAAGEFYARTNRYRDAVEYYNMLLSAIIEDPKKAEMTKTTRSRIIALWLALGDLDNAKRDIDVFMAQYPGDAQGMIYEGAYQRIGGDIQKAKEAFDAHLEKDPDNAVALWQRGQMYMLMGKWAQAADDLRKSKTFNADGFLYQHRIALSTALGELGRTEEAIVELRSILDKDPSQQLVAEALVDAYLRARPPRFSDAESTIYAYMRQYPKDYRWPMLLGRLGERWNKLDKAIEGYEKASELAREAPEVAAALIRAYQKANRPEAIIDFVAAKVPAQQLSSMPLQLAALGWAYHQAKQQDKALEMYDNAMSAASQNFLAYLQVISDMTYVLGKDVVLKRATERAEADPENVEKQKMLVHLLQINDKYQEALDTCEKVEKMAVRDADTIFALLGQGMLLESPALNKPEEARAKYEAALKVDPKHAICLNNLAYLLSEKLNRPAEALPYAKEAAQVDRRNADVLDTYGWILYQNKRLGEAERNLFQALEIERENVPALYHLAILLTEKKEYDEARRRLTIAKELATSEGAKRFLPKINEALENLAKTSP